MIIKFSRGKRVLKSPGALGVAIRNKVDARGSGSGTGDAFLVDLDSRIFGVADSSERNETASKRFLVAFRQVVGDRLKGVRTRSMSDEELVDCLSLLRQATGEMLLGFGYHDSTAFSAIVVCEGVGGRKGMLFHCGDTRAYLFDRRRKTTVQLTRTNAWLVGRIASFPQVELVDLPGDTLLLFGTDGLSDLERHSIVSHGETILSVVGDVLAGNPVEDVPEALLSRCGEAPEMGDDICLVSIDPSACGTGGPVLLGGGTTGFEDRQHQLDRAACHEDLYEVLEWEGGELIDLSKW